MKKLLLALLLASPAYADTFTFTWEAPTVDVSGAPLTELTGYKLYVSTKSGTYTAPVSTISGLSAIYDESKVGKYYAVVTAYNSGGESVYSNEVQFEVKQKAPGAPKKLSFLQKLARFFKKLVHGFA